MNEKWNQVDRSVGQVKSVGDIFGILQQTTTEKEKNLVQPFGFNYDHRSTLCTVYSDLGQI